MNHVSLLIAFLALLVCGAAKVQTDKEIAAALVGSWAPTPAERVCADGRTTYYADGHGVELIWPLGKPESSGVRIETRWWVWCGAAVLGCGFGHRPGACFSNHNHFTNWRRDAAATRRRDACATERV